MHGYPPQDVMSLFRGGTLIEEGRFGNASSVVDNEFSFRLCAGGEKSDRSRALDMAYVPFFFTPFDIYPLISFFIDLDT